MFSELTKPWKIVRAACTPTVWLVVGMYLPFDPRETAASRIPADPYSVDATPQI